MKCGKCHKQAKISRKQRLGSNQTLYECECGNEFITVEVLEENYEFLKYNLILLTNSFRKKGKL